MKTNKHIVVMACAGLFCGCAAAVTVPRELINARDAFERASTGVATIMAPAELYVACQALAKAEQSFKKSPDSYQTRDLAYIAERTSVMAEISASINIELGKQIGANDYYRKTDREIVAKASKSLSGTQEPLNAAESERSGEITAKRLSPSREASAAVNQREKEALAVLAKLVEIKQEPRGMVIVLSGRMLFASGQSVLLPDARSLLDPMIDVLLIARERNLTIEGHTDSQGFDDYNIDFSQRRANAVRDYLVQREYQFDRIRSHGLGEGCPIADNASAEGREKNRRVEIIIEKESLLSNKR